MKPIKQQFEEAIDSYVSINVFSNNSGSITGSNEASGKCEQISDEFAVKFAEWKDENFDTCMPGMVYTPNKIYQLKIDNRAYNIKELLTKFKEHLTNQNKYYDPERNIYIYIYI